MRIKNLKLIARTEEDLKVISAHLQDSIVNISDIANLEKNKIYVQRKECAARGSSFSMRIVPLPKKAKDLLRSFKNKEGKIINLTKGSARNGFDRAKKKADLNNLRFHDLRHIALSRMWSYGMNALEISACSGHRDIKMLMRYSHYQLTY